MKKIVTSQIALLFAKGLLATTSLSFGFACSDGDDARLELVDSPPKEETPAVDLNAERQRLTELQQIRIWNPVGNAGQGAWEQHDPTGFSYEALGGCLNSSASTGSGDACGTNFFYTQAWLCGARVLETVAELRAQPLKWNNNKEIPPQSSETQAALLRQSLWMIANGLESARYSWLEACEPEQLNGFVIPAGTSTPSTHTVAGTLAQLISDGYHQYAAVADKAVGVTIAAADAARGSTPDLLLATTRQFAMADLSRAAAAHLLIGGQSGIHGSETQAFCSSPELTPQAGKALRLLRELGMAPSSIISERLPIATFLDGSLLSLPSGSVRERWLLTTNDSVPAGTTIADHLGLIPEDFILARDYLQDEFKAFGRSLNQLVVGDELTAVPEAECIEIYDFSDAGQLSDFDTSASPSGCDWTITSNTLREATNTEDCVAVHESEVIEDGYVEARARSTDDDTSGLIIRYVDDENYYKFTLAGSGSARLIRVENGEQTTFDSNSIPDFSWASPGHVLRFSAIGEQLQGSVDGVVVVATTDDTFTSGKAGVFDRVQDPSIFDDLVFYSTERASGCATLPSGTLNVYAATATEPQDRSDEYWATIARYSSIPVPSTFDWTTSHSDYAIPESIPVTTNLAELIDTTLSIASLLVDKTLEQDAGEYLLDDAAREQAGSVLSQLLAFGKKDRPGRLKVSQYSGRVDFDVMGYRLSHNLRLVNADNLSCAVMGHIEGQQCELEFVAEPRTQSSLPNNSFPGFPGYTPRFEVSTTVRGRKLYVVRPADPDNLDPGTFKALAGYEERGWLSSTTPGITVIPIVPAIAARAGDILKPSKAWCSFPGEDCAGGKFDERMPLENELSEDNQDPESSWRHYLALAKENADEAQGLAEAYINAGLELDYLTRDEQLREAQDKIRFMTRAESELEKVQEICGTTLDTVQLLEMLGANPGLESAPPCSEDTQCQMNYYGECVAGRCVQTTFQLMDSSSVVEQVARLKRCIGEGTVKEIASLGMKPVCLWKKNKQLCDESTITNPCPVVADRDLQGNYTCADVDPPSGATLSPPVVDMVGLFDNSGAVPVRNACEGIRRLRIGSAPLSPSEREAVLQDVISSNVFLESKLNPAVEFYGKYGNRADIRIGGWPKWTTGQVLNEAAFLPLDKWPCQLTEEQVESCARTPFALFCQKVNCATYSDNVPDEDARKALVNRLLKAVWLLHASMGATHPGNFDPWVDDNYNDPFNNPPNRIYHKIWVPQTEHFDGGQQSKPADGVPLPHPLFDAVTRHVTHQHQVISSFATTNFTEYSSTSTDPRNLYLWDGLSAVPANGEDMVGFGELFTWTQPGSADTGFPSLKMAWNQMATAELTPPTSVSIADRTVLNILAVGSGGVNNAYPVGTPVGHYLTNPGAVEQFRVPFVTPLNLLDNETWLDAAELFCEATYVDPGTETGCPQMTDAAFTDPQGADLLAASMNCEIRHIQQRMGSFILQRVPTHVIDNLVESAVQRAFPGVGGKMQIAISRLRGALLRYRDKGFDLQRALVAANKAAADYSLGIKQVGVLDEQTAIEISQNNIRIEQEDLRIKQRDMAKTMGLVSSVISVAAQAAGAYFTGGATLVGGNFAFSSALGGYAALGSAASNGGGLLGSVLTNFLGDDYEDQISDLEKQYLALEDQSLNKDLEYNMIEKAKLLSEAQTSLTYNAILIAQTVNAMRAELEEFDAALGEIETLRDEALRAVARATQFQSSEAAITEEIEGVLNSRLDSVKRRYKQSHKNAVRYAFLAKRAIEQRLGMRLSDLTWDLPLVDAPSKWESALCKSTGVDYALIKQQAKEADGSPANAAAHADYADPFIGDYVNRLENVVESYVLEYGFQEGLDEAVISLRDDVSNVREICPVTVDNDLYFSDYLRPTTALDEAGNPVPSWQPQNCPSSVPVDQCVITKDTGDLAFQAQENSYAFAPAFDLTFADNNAKLMQGLSLAPGRYRFSWHIKSPGAAHPSPHRITLESGGSPTLLHALEHYSDGPAGWERQYVSFDLAAPDIVYFGFGRLPGSTDPIRVSAPMVENISEEAGNASANRLKVLHPAAFIRTNSTRTALLPVCSDTDGSQFRLERWQHRCELLCRGGFATDCPNETAAEYCFWETSFQISQRDIEKGIILDQSGFARGNFNYRTEGIGINFVGTGARDCEGAVSPEACFGGGFIPFSLTHSGPFLVRNHLGKDFDAKLFTGNIEHARGLATERYLTNPLSEADRSLLTPYLRSELQGRPLDGAYTLRVWDEPGVSFNAISDVQVYLKYRYWTRNN